MAFIGEALVTKIMEKLFEVGFSYMADRCCQTGGMKDELQSLQVALPRIQAVVAAADNALTPEQQAAHPGLQPWLQQFKDALYEADDALDELEYLRLQKQVEADDDTRDEDHNKKRGVGDTSLDEPPHKLRRLLPNFMPFFKSDHNKVPHCFSNSKQSIIKFGKRFFKPDPTLNNLRRAVKGLDEVAAGVKDFVALVSIGQQSQHQQHQSRTTISRETGCLVTESIIFGRDNEKEKLLQWLMEDQPDQVEKNNISLYSVVGFGGMGKTTLVQHVYNDDNVKKSFDLKMWVCVSTSFDVKRITTAILESATKNKPNIDNLATLQDALKDKLQMSSNKFLLVLDDVWDDQKNSSDWKTVLAPLRYGHKGSKILLTTRVGKVANEAMRAVGGSTEEFLKLDPIHGDDFFSVFNRYAFAGINSGDYKELQSLGTKIAERLGGSPLAAKIIGALLNAYLDESYWRSILNCKNISDQGQQPEGNIKSILMLSYHQLPLYLRPCFAFCSTFPQDYRFDKEDLVLKWMALGLIQPSPQNEGQEPEDIGRNYFDELFNRSFFEQKKGYDSECYYIMHDLLHEMAGSVSHGECLSIVNDDKSVEDIPNTVRHLYLATNNLNLVTVENTVKKWQQLRSLQIRINDYVPPEFAEVLEKVLRSLKCVRMLDVSVYYWHHILEPKPLDVLDHLRHLRSLIINNWIRKFPASLCKLHNLQVLKLRMRDSTAALPENMKNLISLRHLVMSSSDDPVIISCPVIIARVRKLASLQALSICIKKERDYRIDELEGLNMIRVLHLVGLENVESPEEASVAKLGNKVHLRVLSLRWGRGNDDTEQQQQILDCLKPHLNLKELTIKGYEGVRPAKWMDFELVDNLQRISLSDCSRLEHLPCFVKLHSLKYLSLKSMPLVKQLDCDCQQLEALYLSDMEGLEELTIGGYKGGYKGVRPAKWMDFELVNNLQRISLSDCSRLEHLPCFAKLHSLKYLYLKSMPLVKQLDCDCQQLEELYLVNMEGMEELTSQSDGNSGQWCPRLRKLLIGDSPKLSVLPSLSLCLESMWLSKVGLTALPKLWLGSEGGSSSLNTLGISSCDMLVDIPAGGLQHLRALRYLSISKFPNLRLDHPTVMDPAGNDENFLPSSLEQLSIEDCGELERSLPTLLNGALTSLSSLSLRGIKSLPCSSVWRRLAPLESLKISNCEELMSLEIRRCPKLVSTATTAVATGSSLLAVDELQIDDPMLLLRESLIRNLTSLRELRITNCRGLESISGEMEEWLLQSRTTLQSLYLDNASSLKSLPDSFQTFSSLEKLTLFYAPELQSVPRLPSSVRFLEISGCNQTLKDRCRKDEGADWPNINHIPDIYID